MDRTGTTLTGVHLFLGANTLKGGEHKFYKRVDQDLFELGGVASLGVNPRSYVA